MTRKADGSELSVVIKLIRPEAADDPKFMAAFVDEARIASMVEHPNLARMYEWGKHEGNLFIAMEYIEGTSLASIMQSLVEQGQRFPPTIGIYIVTEVLKGLVYAHGMKDAYGNPLQLVHRAVNPPNIALSAVGEVKLVDFGMAKVASEVQDTLPGVFSGKFTYMAPEQILHKGVDSRADLYSCGVVLYELLSGNKLKATSDGTQAHSVVDAARARPPSSVHPDIPAELDELIIHSMSESLEQRPASTEAMLEDLSSFLNRWDRKVDAEVISTFLVDTLTGRVGQKKDRASFAFGEATSEWMARGDKLIPVGDRIPAPSGHLKPRPPEPSEPQFKAPSGKFKGGETVMAIEEGGLGKGRQLKTLLLVGGVLLVAVLAIVLVVSNLGKEEKTTERLKKPPEATEPVATEGFAGALHIKSTPHEVLVFVDGDLVEPEGKPPRIMGLRAGTHRIKLVAAGYLPWEEDVTLETEKPHTIEQKLEVRRGQVVITSVPSRATVYLNGRRAGRTPKTFKKLPANRTYNVVLKYKRRKARFKIEPSDWPKDPAEGLKFEKKLEKKKRTRKRRRRRRRR
jgi:serine/threonine-protein kinase